MWDLIASIILGSLCIISGVGFIALGIFIYGGLK